MVGVLTCKIKMRLQWRTPTQKKALRYAWKIYETRRVKKHDNLQTIVLKRKKKSKT